MVIDTYRLCGHSKSDDRCYRSREEEAYWAKRDPLLLAEMKLGEKLSKEISDNINNKIDTLIHNLMNGAFPSAEGMGPGW